MKRIAPILLIFLGLAATEAVAEGTSHQPLNRADCEKVGLSWNDNANVCDVVFGEAESKAQSDMTAASTGQPLTRKGCDQAGMHWNDFANVCEETSEEEPPQIEAKTNLAATSKILITIDKDAQKMTVSIDEEELYDWPVSTGLPKYSTPSGEFTARSMNKIWYSKEWDNAPMPHAIFFTREGHAIHGTDEVARLGKPASHGCVRLSQQNAATLYTLVADKGLENTDVVLTGVTPGRDAYMARSSTQKSQSSRAASRKSKADRSSSEYSLAPTDNADVRSKKRKGGLFRRLFGGR